MARTYTIIYQDTEIKADFLEHAAALHKIPADLFIKRCVSEILEPMHHQFQEPDNFNSLEDFLVGNGLKKSIKPGWEHLVIMTEPGNSILSEVKKLAQAQKCRPEELALRYIIEGVRRNFCDHGKDHV